MIIWYKNSFLASVVSILGCSAIMGGIMTFMSDSADRGMSIPVAIGLVIGGFLLVLWGKYISDKKAQKKQAKLVAQAKQHSTSTAPAFKQTVATPVSNPVVTPVSRPVTTPAATPVSTPVYNTQAAFVPQAANHNIIRKPVKASTIFAGIFFIFTIAASLWLSYETGILNRDIQYMIRPIIIYTSCFFLMLSSFITRATQEISFLHPIGFLGITAIYAEKLYNIYKIYGFGGYSTAEGIYYNLFLDPLLYAAAFLLLTIFSIFSMKKAKVHLGGIVRALCLIPVLIHIILTVKYVNDSGAVYIVRMMFEKGNFSDINDILIEAASQIFMSLALFFTGIAFQRVCKKPVVIPIANAPYFNPVSQRPVYTSPAQSNPIPQQSVYTPAEQYKPVPQQPVYTPPVQPDPVPQKTEFVEQTSQPETVKAVANEYDEETAKKYKAYKDLLDCGILSQEEFDENIKKLTRK